MPTARFPTVRASEFNMSKARVGLAPATEKGPVQGWGGERGRTGVLYKEDLSPLNRQTVTSENITFPQLR